MWTDNRKVIVWFLVALALAAYVKYANLVPQSGVLGAETETKTSPGFGPLLQKSK